MLSIYFVLFFSHRFDPFIPCLLSQKQWHYPRSQQSSENPAIQLRGFFAFTKLSAASERMIFVHLYINTFQGDRKSICRTHRNRKMSQMVYVFLLVNIIIFFLSAGRYIIRLCQLKDRAEGMIKKINSTIQQCNTHLVVLHVL